MLPIHAWAHNVHYHFHWESSTPHWAQSKATKKYTQLLEGETKSNTAKGTGTKERLKKKKTQANNQIYFREQLPTSWNLFYFYHVLFS